MRPGRKNDDDGGGAAEAAGPSSTRSDKGNENEFKTQKRNGGARGLRWPEKGGGRRGGRWLSHLDARPTDETIDMQLFLSRLTERARKDAAIQCMTIVSV